MNIVIMMGRLTKDAEVRYGGANNTAVARFSIAVDRRYKREGQPDADFFNCTAFGKTAEFIEKYLHKGSKVVIQGELQNDHYKEKDGHQQYAEKVIVNSVEFAESKKAALENQQAAQKESSQDDFMDVPKDNPDLPFI